MEASGTLTTASIAAAISAQGLMRWTAAYQSVCGRSSSRTVSTTSRHHAAAAAFTSTVAAPPSPYAPKRTSRLYLPQDDMVSV